MPLDRAQVRQQRRGELVAVLEAEKSGKLGKCLALRRQRMRLLIRHHLQTMLDAAQEIVRRRQFVAGRVVDPAAGGERAGVATVERPRRPGCRPPSNELLGLHEELDLADAAAAELDIVPLDRNLARVPGRRGFSCFIA